MHSKFYWHEWNSCPSHVLRQAQLASRRPRIRQRFQPTSGEYLCELVHQCFVDQSIRCHGLATVGRIIAALIIRNAAPGFFDDHYASGCVPGVQIELPKTIEAPASHIAKIQCGRTSAAYTMSSQCNLMIEVDVRIVVTFVARETCRQKRPS